MLAVVGLQQIDGVVIAAATQEGEEIAAPVRDLESEHVAVELHGPRHVGGMEGDVSQLARHDAGIAVVVLGKAVVGEDFDAGAFGIGEHDGSCDAGRDVAPRLRLDPGLGQARGELAEIAPRRNLKGEPQPRRPLAVLEHDHLLPGLGREDRTVLLLGNEAQADDARVIVELALEIGRGERRMSNSLDLQHRTSPLGGRPATCRALSG